MCENWIGWVGAYPCWTPIVQSPAKSSFAPTATSTNNTTPINPALVKKALKSNIDSETTAFSSSFSFSRFKELERTEIRTTNTKATTNKIAIRAITIPNKRAEFTEPVSPPPPVVVVVVTMTRTNVVCILNYRLLVIHLSLHLSV